MFVVVYLFVVFLSLFSLCLSPLFQPPLTISVLKKIKHWRRGPAQSEILEEIVNKN